MTNEKGNTRIRFGWEGQLRGSPTDAYTKAIGLILATYCDSKGTAYPSVPTLAKKASLSPKRTRALLHGLAKEHWITITFGGEGAANRYRLTTPKYADLMKPRRSGTKFADGDLCNEQRFVWERAVLESEVLDFAQKSMALTLATYETNLLAAPSIEELADASSRSRRRVYQLLKDLADGGWVKVTLRGRNKSNVYELTIGNNTHLQPLRSMKNDGNECATGGRGPTDGKEVKRATGEHVSVPRAGNECATGKPERATGGRLTPVVIPGNKTPLANLASSVAHGGVSDDIKKRTGEILVKCDSTLGPAFRKDRLAMNDQRGFASMITQLLAREMSARAIVDVITEGGYPSMEHPARAAYGRLRDYIGTRAELEYPHLPMVQNEEMLSMFAQLAETMRARTNETLGLRDRKVPAKYIPSYDAPSFDAEFS